MKPDRPISRLLSWTLAPATALTATVAALQGLHYTRVSEHFEQGLDHVAWVQISDRVLRDGGRMLLAAAALSVIAVLFARPERRRALWGSAVLWCELALVPLIAFLSSAGDTLTERRGIVLPSNLWTAFSRLQLEGQWSWAWIVVPTVAGAGVVALWLGSRRRDLPFPGPRATRWMLVLSGLCLLSTMGGSGFARWRSAPDTTDRPHVVFVTWDSLRADHLSFHGYERETTPVLTRLAQDSVVFRNATSQHNWTRPSYATMLTSRYTWEFGDQFMGHEQITLAELLRNAGYRTHGFVQNQNLDTFFRFHQGFDEYYALFYEYDSWTTTRRVQQRLDAIDFDAGPVFLFIHYWRPHYRYPFDNPYVAEYCHQDPFPLDEEQVNQIMSHSKGLLEPDDPQHAHKVRFMVDLYDATIRETDDAFAALLESLREHMDLDQALFVFNSDHGDEFYEHGDFGHSTGNLHPELVHVPFFLKPPGGSGISPGPVDDPVMNLDLIPTVLDAVGIDTPFEFSGQSLWPRMQGQSSPERVIVSTWGNLVAVRKGPFKLIQSRNREDSGRFYDLRSDPGEQSPLPDIKEHPAARELARVVEAIRRQAQGSAEVTPDQEDLPEQLREELRALGYVE